MREYKRFTEKRKGKNVIPLLNSVCGVDLPHWTIETASDIRSYLSGNAVDRFSELEDKIEQGELFSIPFMYHNKKLNAYTVLYEDDNYEYLMGQVFRGETAKEEAEKFLEQKLKELKGEV